MSSIRKGLQKAFNIEASESLGVILLLVQSFFIGIFYGVFDVGATSIFLKVYPETMIAKAYLISGLAGIILTSVYSSLQSRIKFSTLTTINLIFIALMTVGLRLGFRFTEEKALAFILLVFMGPLKINAIVGFNGTVVRMFSLRQGKRLYGLVDSGQILGIILSGYSISLLLGFNFATMNLFYISAVSILLAVFIQLLISGRFNLEVDNNNDVRKGHSKESRLTHLLKSRYVGLMAIFVILSMLVMFFLQYSFLAVTKTNYPDNREFAIFLGAFMATLYVFTILVKTFVYSKFIKAYGLRTTLLVSPIILMVFTAIAAIIGSFFGYTKEAGSFTFFFLIISLSRLFVQTFKDAFEIPSFKLLYQSLSIRIRHAVQARIDGTVNEFAAVFAGFLLTVLVTLSFIKLIHFTYVLGVILVVWAFVAMKLYKGYRKALEKSLAEAKTATKSITLHTPDRYTLFNDAIAAGNAEEILKTLTFIKLSEPNYYHSALISSVAKSDQSIKDFVWEDLKSIKALNITGSLEKNINSVQDKGLKKILKEFVQGTGISKDPIPENKIAYLAKSPEPNDRIQAIRYIAGSDNPAYLSNYNILLRDLNHEVRIAAINYAPKTGYIETIPVIIDYLGSRLFYSYAFAAIEAFGENALKYLEHAFYKTGMEDKIILRIIRLMSKIGNDKAISFLLGKIDHYNRDIVRECVNGLMANGFRADENTFIPIQQALFKTISMAAWNLSAQNSVDASILDPYFTEALAEEIKENHDLLFSLLSLAYDPKSIMHVRENLESGTAEGIGFAIELMDIFLAEELKPTLFPLLDDTAPADKVRQLQNEFPIDKMDTETLLLSIINRDYNAINNWTRLCAIENLNYLDGFNINDAIIAQLFHPSSLLHEAAALYINKKAPEIINQVRGRIDNKIKSGIETALKDNHLNHHHLQSHKVKYLKHYRVFNSLPGILLVSMSKLIEDIPLFKDQEYSLTQDTDHPALCMVPEGAVELEINPKDKILLSDFQCYSFYGKKEFDKMVLKAKKDSYIYLIKLRDLNELMFDHPDITELLLHESIKQNQEEPVITM